jgi:hypothetical protein
MIKLTNILKEILLKEELSSKEQEALENLFSFYIGQNYIAIDGNKIKTDKFEDIFQWNIDNLQEPTLTKGTRDCSTGNCSFTTEYEDNEEFVGFLKSIKNKLISYLIDNIGEKIKVENEYYYSPFVKNNIIHINFIPLDYSEEKDTKYVNPKGIKIDSFPLEINGYKFYAYWNHNPEVKLGKGANVAEFQTVRIPEDNITKYSLATLPGNTKKRREENLERRIILMNYLKQNNIPFLIDTRDPGRSYIQVPLTYTKEYY